VINYWLIALLCLIGVSWVITLMGDSKSTAERLGRVVGLLLVGGLMYMAGVFTELWGVYY